MRLRLVLVPLGVAACALALAAPLLAAQMQLEHDDKLVPGALGWQRTLFLVAIAAPVVHVVLLFAVIPGRRRRYSVLTTLLQVAVSLALVGGAISTSNDMFRGELTGSARSPDGAHTAYVETGGILCGYSVYVADRGAETMHPVGGGIDCDDQLDYDVVWIDDTTVQVQNARGPVDTIRLPR